MLRNLFLTLLAVSLSSCSHGLRVSPCISDPTKSIFDCTNYKDDAFQVAFSAATNYSVLPQDDAQSLLSWCSARNQVGNEPLNTFTMCKASSSGLNCTIESCTQNVASNGLSCSAKSIYTLTWDKTDNYVGFSDADSIAMLAYCNIRISQ